MVNECGIRFLPTFTAVYISPLPGEEFEISLKQIFEIPISFQPFNHNLAKLLFTIRIHRYARLLF